jgi:hypothetical protein
MSEPSVDEIVANAEKALDGQHQNQFIDDTEWLTVGDLRRFIADWRRRGEELEMARVQIEHLDFFRAQFFAERESARALLQDIHDNAYPGKAFAARIAKELG